MSETVKTVVEWADVEKVISRLWLSDIRWVAESRPRKSPAGVDRVYGNREVFIAILRILWDNHPIRKPLGNGYPGVHPVHERLHYWAEHGYLQKIWSTYLAGLSKSELTAWAERFNAPTPPRTGNRRHAFWYVEMIRELNRNLEKAGIDVPPVVAQVPPAKPPRRSGLGDLLAV